MEKTTVEFMSNLTHKLTSIPIVLFEKDEVKKEWQNKKVENVFGRTLRNLLASEKNATLLLTPQSLMFCAVKIEDSDFTVIYGPVKTMNINSTVLQDILIDIDLSLEKADALRSQLNSVPTMRLEYFAILCASFYCNLNHKIVTPNELLDQVSFESTDIHFEDMLLTKTEQIVFGEAPPHNTYDYEQKMLYCVRNGLTEEMQKLGNLTENSHVAVVTQDTMRHYKNMILAQKTLISRAAIEGGADPETAFSMSDIYSQKIETAHSINSLSALSQAMRREYCELVKETKHPQTDDFTVNKAIAYIREHVYEKISAPEIAQAIGITCEYLATKFKKKTGYTIPTFITEQKIFVACKLLKFTNKPLIEISNFLSFSSQSYFQTSFKKITGMTPLEYKEKGK